MFLGTGSSHLGMEMTGARSWEAYKRDESRAFHQYLGTWSRECEGVTVEGLYRIGGEISGLDMAEQMER